MVRTFGMIWLSLVGFFAVVAILIQTSVLPRLTVSLPQIEGRQLHWQRAVTAIEMFPITGTGMSMYRQLVHVLYPQFLVYSEREIAHAHNMYLQVALDVGLPGLVAYLALMALAFYMLFKSWRTVTDAWQRGFVIGGLIGMSAHLIYGFTDTVALRAKPGIAFWILLGLIVGLFSLNFSPSILNEESLENIQQVSSAAGVSTKSKL